MPQAGIPTRNAGGETPELFQLVARPLKETNGYKGAILSLQFARLKSARDSDKSNGMPLQIGLRRFNSLIGAKAETLCLTEIELRVMPLRQNVDREINATLCTNTEGQSVPLIYKLLVVAVMIAMVAAAMLFVLLVRIG